MMSFSALQSSKIRLPPSSVSHSLHRSSLLTFNTQRQSTKHHCLCTTALDAPQASDYEAVINDRFQKRKKLKIAIVGFGNFGQFLAKTLVRQGRKVLAHSISDCSDIARTLGVSFFTDTHDLCEEHPEVVLLCTSIISTESVLRLLPLQKLKRSTLFVDVLSVKEFPKKLLLQILPSEFDVLCTHPMFGPESGKDSWKGLPFVYEKVRIRDEESNISRCEKFLDIFAQEGCRMVEMSCAEHDKEAAGSQFITHTIGRILEKVGLESTSINTKGYETLLNLVENTSGDSFDLYFGLFMYNKNAIEQLERLLMAFESLKKQLFGHSHDILRKQLFENVGDIEAYNQLKPVILEILQNGNELQHDHFEKRKKLKIAIVGFGNFGQFLAKTLVRQGHHVLAHSISDCSDMARKLGVSFFTDTEDLCEEHPEVVLLCTSILSTEAVLKSLPLQKLKRSTLFVDVLSVKEFPRKLLLQILPSEFDVLCTHPMFGPESGKDSWKGLPFVYEKVRIGDEESRISRYEKFLDIFAQEGCRLVEMSCAEHDREAAGSQFITHTMGRILEKFGIKSTSINTKGYETLLNLVKNTSGDSFDLYYGLFMYNKNAMEQLERLDMAFESLKIQLFGNLHDILRKQRSGNAEGIKIVASQNNG
ncbi:hypothetical protein MKW94_009958 [Papaver nudicaule]|uniref:Prephenate/arogenate dehydrogenase domain-containing protein n=1 Tax=Papaver nudicaule TaxID=74823 RepID=A0AA41VVK6_PAPNU|nr:hypothetical protein [Papaver nudicaule]